jgi:starch synthase
MRIAFVTSEAVPFAKTGGLADVSGALPKALKSLGHEPMVFMPRYRGMKGEMEKIADTTIIMGDEERECTIFRGEAYNIPFYFIWNEHYFDREGLYQEEGIDYPDNWARFAFFSKATIETIKLLDLRPDILHCNDWQTGLVPAYIALSEDPYFSNTATVFTIHNLAYQGIFPKEVLPKIGIGWEAFNMDGLEFYGNVNFLKAGLVYSDVINTVSETYSKEIQLPEFGYGLDGVLRWRSDSLYGILNGIDYEEWDPRTDKVIFRNYGPEDLEGKEENKRMLQRELDLPERDVPVMGMVSRLAEQKGLDLMEEVMDELMKWDVQLVILGTGTPYYHKLLLDMKGSYPHKISVNLRYDPILANKIYAGSDMFLMPSKYEPCGLGQMIALRYGTIPIVHKTGGLADTIQDYDPQLEIGNGFSFDRYTPVSFLGALARAMFTYLDRDRWKRMVKRGMEREDFSWGRSAAKYEELYQKARGRRVAKGG